MRIMDEGKPSGMTAGCAWGVLLAPAVLLGGGWLLGQLTHLLRAIFG